MQQKNILFMVTKPVLGGVSKDIIEITKKLPKEIMPYYIIGCEGYLSKELINMGINENQIFFVPMTNSIINISTHIKSITKTLKILENIKPYLVTCNSTTAGIVGRVSGLITNTPVIFTHRGLNFTPGISMPKRIFYYILESILSFMTKKIICVAEHDYKLCCKLMPFSKNKFITIHNGLSDIDKNLIKKEDTFSKEQLKIVMITRFSAQKNPYDLINAVKELNDEKLNIKLDLYGYGEELDKVISLVNTYNYDNITYVGVTESAENVLKEYDLFALITHYEGLPVSIIEALRSGVPVLASDVAGCGEMIDGNGFLVKRENKEDLKDKLRYIYKNMYILPEMGKRSRELYEKEYTANLMFERTYKLMNYNIY